MTEHAIHIVLWMLGILVVILTALVGAVYSIIRKDQSDSDARMETIRTEDMAAKKEIWVEINALKEHYHDMKTIHVQLCQKHEDAFIALENALPTIKTNVKSQGDFFLARVQELDRVISGIQKRINKSCSPKS